MALHLTNFDLFTNLSEFQQESITGAECTRTDGENYVLIECSETTEEKIDSSDDNGQTTTIFSPANIFNFETPFLPSFNNFRWLRFR